jgi:transcriptional regulator with XRE-family HTH domain
MDANCFADIFAKAQDNPRFWEEMSILEFTESVAKRLESLNFTRMDLASKMEVSPAFITKLMCGNNNFTLRTMVKVARALNCELAIGLVPTDQPAQVSLSENSNIVRLHTMPELRPQDARDQFTLVRGTGTPQFVVSGEIVHPPENADLSVAA